MALSRADKSLSLTEMADAETPPATPMMVQYFALKREAEDCLLFYRMGDFFELFFDDAKIAARTLDIALTSRGEHQGAPIPMCGVPVHAAEAYLARLIRGGHRVAIAEQTESPAAAKARGGKSIVARGIVRVVTAGTLTEEALLESRSANWLVALAPVAGGIGYAAADISTGRFEIGETDEAALDAELARLGAAEIVVPDGAALEGHVRPRPDFDSITGERRLKSLFGVASLDGFGGFSRAELAACGGLLAYLDHAGKGALPFLEPPQKRSSADHMAIDAATRDSLELVRAAGGNRAGSLLDAVDRTVTGAGARMLGGDIAAPLMDQAAITARLDLVSWFAEGQSQRESVRAALKALPDVARALGRIAAGRGSPRDLGQLRDGLHEARVLREKLSMQSELPALLVALLPALNGHGALVDQMQRALVPSPPIDASAGGSIAEGYDAALDELRALGGDGRRAMAALEAQYRGQTGVATLRIKHNNVLGYHIEVSARNADGLMAADSGFTHRQTLAGAVRFNAPELHELAVKPSHIWWGVSGSFPERHRRIPVGMRSGRCGGKRSFHRSKHACRRKRNPRARTETPGRVGWRRPAFGQNARAFSPRLPARR